jgi:PKD repeat protein
MRYALLPIFVIFAALLVACTPTPAEQNTTPTGDVAAGIPPATPSETPAAQAAPEKPALYTVEGIEGDLIQLKPEAVDPDGERVVYSFTSPFDTNGRWQTKIGDEGTYNVVVGASDGKATTTETVKVIVHRANRPSVIECKPITVNEGDIVNLHDRCTITDEDDKEVIVTYSGWMGSWRYQTTYDDAGTHTVTITASDKRQGKVLHTVTKDVTITVKDVNRPPVFSDKFPAQISGVENDVITLPASMVTDPDGNPLTITYSSPFDKSGVWKTKIGDAGTYDVDVAASDGTSTMKKTVKVKIAMLNTPPVLKTIPDITVKEGETIKLPISAHDREGDKLTTTISGWMTGDTYKTTYDDAGNYTVKVTVTDGEFNTSQVVHITVLDVNRPPVFIVPA